MKFKYIISDQFNPYYNLALEQYLFDFVDNETCILYLWQNDNTIVVGKNQNIEVECKVEEFLAQGGIIARRKSGGGAVYHDFGNLNFSIISKADITSEMSYQKIVTDAVLNLGLEAEFNGRNDIIIDNKKFSGNAVYDNGKVACQHGTILISSNIEKMTYFLTPDESKLARHHVKSVSSRVVNLSELEPNITVDIMKKSMIETTKSEQYMIKIEHENVEEIMRVFSSHEWLFGGK